jgi:hypothetical protein
MARNANPTPDTTIAVRVDIVVKIDPALWPADVPAAEVDTDAVVKGLVAAGIPEDQAKVMAAKVTEAPADANTPSAVRTAVRQYVLAQVGTLEKITTAKASVVDRAAAEKAAAAAKTQATTPAAK